MARTASTMLELGTTAPDFNLPDPRADRRVARTEFVGQPLLVAFICNHCPYVIHIREALLEFVREYRDRGISTVAISANDIGSHPNDGPLPMAKLADELDFPMPYLYDQSQQVAKAYKAACTPDFFLFDADHRLVYRGQFDSSRPGNDVPVDGADLRAAADALLAGQALPTEQVPSIGCNIKWRSGNEPDYFGA